MNNTREKKVLVLFDFDGTITKKDSFVDFLLFGLGITRFFLGFLLISPMIFLYFVKLFPNWKMKELTISLFFKGISLEDLKDICRRYGREKLAGIVRTNAQERINWHLEKGHAVVIITATIEYYLNEWCQKQNIKLIATKIQIKNGKITGKINGKICYGKEKVRRIKEKYDLHKYKKIYAYGDSQGDIPMLNLANIRYYDWKKY